MFLTIRNTNLTFDVSFRVSLLTLAAVLGVAAASAAERPSHLGQDIANHVTLEMTVFEQHNCARDATRIFPDGTEDFEFTIPSGKSLVVTDVQWRALESFVPPLEVGRNLSLVFWLGAEPPAILFRSPLLVTGENIDALAKSEHLTAGFMMSAIPSRRSFRRKT